MEHNIDDLGDLGIKAEVLFADLHISFKSEPIQQLPANDSDFQQPEFAAYDSAAYISEVASVKVEDH